MSRMEIHGDEIADVVLAQFHKLPKKRKPQLRADGLREWVPLCGIVAEDGCGQECIALGTGMKCLPESKISSAKGMIIHDWHAEIICMRAFNRFLLEECMGLTSGIQSRYLEQIFPHDIDGFNPQQFTIKDDVRLYMYCSEAPCGDASMELTMAAQQDATPWAVQDSLDSTSLTGRGYFSQLGIVRRKPSRPDAPPTLSKSCSDKLAMRQVTSLLSSMTSLFISPSNAYLHTLVLPTSQYAGEGCGRAFGAAGRLALLSGSGLEGDYSLRPFNVITTEREFEFSRRSAPVGQKLISSNLAALWSAHFEESLIGGVLQGRKLGDPRGASVVSRRRMAELALLIFNSLISSCVYLINGEVVGRNAVYWTDYNALKSGSVLEARRNVKETVIRTALKGWTKNTSDNFSINGTS